ncbi:uncharacterized protein [Watersipora subatra]|uniref:uncharacterized protein n=1 Tax=Watersipora subatra TaxID=2589382 RepID=UPI00355C6BC2
MAAFRFNVNDFPRLVINSSDAANSYKSWLSEINLCVEVTTLQMGKAKGGQVNFSGPIKLLVLLSAIGKDGCEALQSVGFSLESHDSTYEQAMDHLNRIYGGRETIYVKVMKFVTCSQTCEENERDYMLRVEKLSRNLNFDIDDNGKDFALAIAVNELRESTIHRQLMQEKDFDRGRLWDILRARQLAHYSEAVLKDAKAKGHESVRHECRSRHRNSIRFSRYSSADKHNWHARSKSELSPKSNRCYNCGSRQHRLRSCPDAKCFACNGKGHTSIDCARNGSENSQEQDLNRYRYERSSSSESDRNTDRGSGRDRDYTRSRHLNRSVRFSSSSPKRLDDKITRTLKVNDIEVDFVLDTGAEASTVTEKAANRLGLKLKVPSTVLTAVDGSELKVVGRAEVQLKSRHTSMVTQVHVIKGLNKNFLA